MAHIASECRARVRLQISHTSHYAMVLLSSEGPSASCKPRVALLSGHSSERPWNQLDAGMCIVLGRLPNLAPHVEHTLS